MSPSWAVLGSVVVVSLACAGSQGDLGSDYVESRDTLASGVVIVRHGPLADKALTEGNLPRLLPNRTLGSVGIGDDSEQVFGDVRSVELGQDGTIYVLDAQASEIRAFSADGEFLRTVVTKGEGPGEILAANGMILHGDSLLWIYDHGRSTMLAVTPDGEEVTRQDPVDTSYGFVWSGTVDHSGAFWKLVVRSDEPFVFPPEFGAKTSRFREYQKSYDPTSQLVDSIFFGEALYPSFVAQTSRGYSHFSIPFASNQQSFVDHAGGFWVLNSAEYRIARLNERGDTVLVIQADVDPSSVTQEDRDEYVRVGLERMPDAVAVLEEIAALMPATKPVIKSMLMDDLGRLWVERLVSLSEDPLFDIFTRDGSYEGSLRLGFQLHPIPIRIRHGKLLAVVLDSLDVPFVVLADVPDMGGR